MTFPFSSLATTARSESELLAESASWLRDHFGAAECDVLEATVQGGLLLRGSTHLEDAVDRARLASGVGLSGAALSSGGMVVVSQGLSDDPRWTKTPGEESDEGESAVAMPFHAESLRGVILLRRNSPWRGKEVPGDELRATASALAEAWSIYRHAFTEGAGSSRLEAVSEVSKSIAATPYLEEVLQILVNLTAQRFNYRVVTVRLADAKQKSLVLRATQATNKAYQNKRAIAMGESIAGQVLTDRKTKIVADVQTDPEYVGHDLAREQGLRSMICLPLAADEDHPLGVLTCYTDIVREFPDDEVAALEALARQAAVSIERARLQARSTLMQEMHHRVKNNLQQVASLIRLQLRQTHYKDSNEALTDSLGRILAIASVHELLSRDDMDHVEIKKIAETLANATQQSVVLPDRSITISVRGDEVYLSTSQGTQVALLINELLQNAVEHGFAKAQEGEIHVNIEDHDSDIGLWISNSGDPLPKDFQPDKGRLGLQIVQSLTRSLGGTFSIENRLGWTVCEVRFSRAVAE